VFPFVCIAVKLIMQASSKEGVSCASMLCGSTVYHSLRLCCVFHVQYHS